jgi:hypothetical protein
VSLTVKLFQKITSQRDKILLKSKLSSVETDWLPSSRLSTWNNGKMNAHLLFKLKMRPSLQRLLNILDSESNDDVTKNQFDTSPFKIYF